MKSTATLPKDPVSPVFPKLMIGKNSRLIVLFSKEGHGCVVHPGTSNETHGRYSHVWNMYDFEDYHGEVVLSNS